MKYNFDQSIDRRETKSYKWDVDKESLSFSVADTDFLVADEISDAINNRAKLATYGYTFVPDEYYEAYIYWWKHRYNLELKKEWFAFSTSIVASIDTILKRITNKGDHVSLLSPNYNVFYNCILNNDLIIEEAPFGYDNYSYFIDWDLLENAIKNSKVFILCNPHNPIGMQFKSDELKRIVELCEKYGVYVLTDEIHCDLDYNKEKYVPLYSVSSYSKIIMLVSPGKSFNLAGLHSSVVITKNKELLQMIQDGLYHDDVGEPSFFSIDPVIAAYTKCEQYVIEENEYIAKNRQILQDFIVKNDLKIQIVGGDATYLLWVDISYYSNNSERFTDALFKEAKIKLCPGKMYHEHYSSFVRINIATQSENIYKLCDGLKSFLDNYKEL